MTVNSIAIDRERVPVRTAVWQRFEMDEPLDVRFGGFDEPAELMRLCRSLPRPPSGSGTSTVVLCLPSDQVSLHLESLLKAVSVADRVVLTSASELVASQWPIRRGDLLAEAANQGMKLVLIEPDAERAVIGAMQWLQPGDQLSVLCSAEIDAARVEDWLTQGSRWRGTQETQDDGVFHHLSE